MSENDIDKREDRPTPMPMDDIISMGKKLGFTAIRFNPQKNSESFVEMKL